MVVSGCYRLFIVIILFLYNPINLFAQKGGEKPTWIFTGDVAPKDSLEIIEWINAAARLNNKDSALALVNRAYHASQAAAYYYGIGRSLLQTGIIYETAGNYKAAQEKFLQSISWLQRSSKGKQHLATAFYKTGVCFMYTGKKENASSYIYKAVNAIATIQGSTLPVETAYMGLAEVLEDNQELVGKYLDTIEAMIRAKNDRKTLGTLLLNKARRYNTPDLRQFEAGETCIIEALQIGKEIQDSLLQFRSYTRLASSKLRQNKPREALDYLKKGAQLGVQEKDVFQQNAHLFLWSEAYYQLKNYSQAEQYGRLALAGSRLLKLKDQEAHAHDMLAVAYAGMGLYQKAYEHHREFKYLKDQVTNETIAGNIQQLEKKYQDERKDRTIAESKLLIAGQQKDLTKKNILLATALVAICFLVIVSFIIYRNYKGRQRLVLQQQEIGLLKAMMRGEEQERKRLAIELHDGIGGMLAAIKMKVGKVKRNSLIPEQVNDLDDINRMLQDTGAEIRRTAHNLIPDILQLHDLQYALLRYCSNIQDTGKLNIILELNGDLNRLNKRVELIVYRLVQELVQNIIKHAEAQRACVQVILFDNQLSITVEDNGKGFDPEVHQEGLGLQQIRYRVKSLGGSIEITSVAYKATIVNILFDEKKLNSVV